MYAELDQSPTDNEAVIKVVKSIPCHGNYGTYHYYDILIYCPLCEEIHYLTNVLLSGSTAVPYTPYSQVIRDGRTGLIQCHFYIRSNDDGRAYFSYLSDCHLGLGADRVQEMIPVSEWKSKMKRKEAVEGR